MPFSREKERERIIVLAYRIWVALTLGLFS